MTSYWRPDFGSFFINSYFFVLLEIRSPYTRHTRKNDALGSLQNLSTVSSEISLSAHFSLPKSDPRLFPFSSVLCKFLSLCMAIPSFFSAWPARFPFQIQLGKCCKNRQHHCARWDRSLKLFLMAYQTDTRSQQQDQNRTKAGLWG